MGTPLEPTLGNLRAEQARYGLKNIDVASVARMRRNLLASYRSGKKKLTPHAAERWARAINTLAGAHVFLITSGQD